MGRVGGLSVDDKFDPWNWLLFTQLFEVFTSRSRLHTAKELADIISVSMEYIEVLGYDPVKTFRERTGTKNDQLAVIFARYAAAYHNMKREMKRWPKHPGK